jgi:8-oxo-dGTP pyrophosphatase MutT (NUDIX family)
VSGLSCGRDSVRGLADPVPPQVIPRPPSWRPGARAAWEALAEHERSGITVERVLGALDSIGQRGPVPADPGVDPLLFPVRGPDGDGDGDGEGDGERDGERDGWATTLEVNAGVLVVMFEEAGETRLILTRRSSALRTHRGEVSFPGGRMDRGEDATAAAVREAREEVALDPTLVTVVGWIRPVMTMVSASLIVPVLATVERRPVLTPSPGEVARVFDVSLAELAAPDVFHEERWSVPGRAVHGSADGSVPVWFFEVSGEMIWGATARMIHELLSIVLTGRSGAGTRAGG